MCRTGSRHARFEGGGREGVGPPAPRARSGLGGRAGHVLRAPLVGHLQRAQPRLRTLRREVVRLCTPAAADNAQTLKPPWGRTPDAEQPILP